MATKTDIFSSVEATPIPANAIVLGFYPPVGSTRTTFTPQTTPSTLTRERYKTVDGVHLHRVILLSYTPVGCTWAALFAREHSRNRPREGELKAICSVSRLDHKVFEWDRHALRRQVRSEAPRRTEYREKRVHGGRYAPTGRAGRKQRALQQRVGDEGEKAALSFAWDASRDAGALGERAAT